MIFCSLKCFDDSDTGTRRPAWDGAYGMISKIISPKAILFMRISNFGWHYHVVRTGSERLAVIPTLSFRMIAEAS